MKPKAPAHYIGTQEGFGTIKAIDLFNLTAPIPGHPVDSTVSRETLELAGFECPALPTIGPLMTAARRRAWYMRPKDAGTHVPFCCV